MKVNKNWKFTNTEDFRGDVIMILMSVIGLFLYIII